MTGVMVRATNPSGGTENPPGPPLVSNSPPSTICVLMVVPVKVAGIGAALNTLELKPNSSVAAPPAVRNTVMSAVPPTGRPPIPTLIPPVSVGWVVPVCADTWALVMWSSVGTTTVTYPPPTAAGSEATLLCSASRIPSALPSPLFGAPSSTIGGSPSPSLVAGSVGVHEADPPSVKTQSTGVSAVNVKWATSEGFSVVTPNVPTPSALTALYVPTGIRKAPGPKDVSTWPPDVQLITGPKNGDGDGAWMGSPGSMQGTNTPSASDPSGRNVATFTCPAVGRTMSMPVIASPRLTCKCVAVS